MPSHSTHINYYTRPACMGLGTLKITNFPIINRTAGLRWGRISLTPEGPLATTPADLARRRRRIWRQHPAMPRLEIHSAQAVCLADIKGENDLFV